LADFVALYRGRTVSEAEIVAVSAEPRLVKRFFEELLGAQEAGQTNVSPEYPAPVLEAVIGDEG
jgi:hypothetical protein